MAAWITIGPRTIVRTCRPIMRASETPDTLAASTYSSFRTARTAARTRLKNAGARSRPNTNIAAHIDVLTDARNARSTTIPGRARIALEIHIPTVSNHRP